MSNVTPINAGGGRSSEPPPKKEPPKRKPKAGLLLFESDEFDGFTTRDVVNALHGVCTAMEHLAVDYSEPESIAELSIAAKVLSSIVQMRVAGPNEVRL